MTVRPFSSGLFVSIGFHAEEARLIYALGDFGKFSVEMEVMSMIAGVHRLRNKVAVFSMITELFTTCSGVCSKKNFYSNEYSTVKNQSRYRKRTSITTQ